LGLVTAASFAGCAGVHPASASAAAVRLEAFRKSRLEKVLVVGMFHSPFGQVGMYVRWKPDD
jgi:hypothetical protein